GRRVSQQAVIAHLQRVAEVLPWPSGERDEFVRINPQQISGRRIVGR
ncbi:MAG: DNA-binding protein, partial [Actinobacteria bacterium]|nr:DNA-binding protein [Actinomycetota bacterium]